MPFGPGLSGILNVLLAIVDTVHVREPDDL
jgi:hypothetical protein